ncbi:MBL fold metallo-hydrolase [Temperatibacter marinus]|uniref:MBL fold metallo-hydrolase n=1 Tax=Temperatibacter marinus TaxID=1456591 RepID=A0AA52HA53_9PROT|nr:MBL fold metallo-hydrolase [Temperatibacter marinus]WND03262.1 MBL fold metallo-hydrolase [Temperatibacter marinus]
MGLDFKFEENPDYGVAQSVTPLVTRVLCENPSPFTYTGTGTYLIGTEDLAIIDPGPLNDDHLTALLKAVDGRPVNAILITHNHSDHSPLAIRLAEAVKAPILGSALPESLKIPDEGNPLDAGLDRRYRPDLEIEDGHLVCGKGWTLKTIHTPGHISHHISFFLEEENSLFCGDHIMGWSTSVIIPPEGHLRSYLKSLQELMEMDLARLYPTHGKPIDNPTKFMRATIVHRHMREGQIVTCLKEGRQTIMEMVTHMYKSVDKKLHGAAALSVSAHLIALIEEGKVTQSEHEDLISATFTLT